MIRVGEWWQAVRTGFWAIPSVCVVAAILLGVGLVRLDHGLEANLGFVFGAGPDGAREVLSAISTSMITFTGLVFSITIVVLQLTSSQFSPRVLRTFLRDRLTQLALGSFVATFVYAVTVLRTVTSGDTAFVPAVSTTVGLGLLLLSVGMFVAYIHHIATSIQVSSILTAIGAETRETLDKRYPPDSPGQAARPPVPTSPVERVIPAGRTGIVTQIDTARLVALACAGDVVLRTGLGPGNFVAEGAPLVEVLGSGAVDPEAVSAAIWLAKDRTMQQDVAFGFRQLVDIAERALSPGINDPTTAVQALDQLHDLLRRLATRSLRDGLYCDGDGTVRVVTPPETFGGYLDLALAEIDQYGSDASQVQARIDVLLSDVLAAARPEHRAVTGAWQRSWRDRRAPRP
ncbi:MAG: DUF2254 domain-containing protein [Propionicimonas sp.]